MLSWVSLRFESFDITRSVEYEDIREMAAMLRAMTPDLIVDEKGPCSGAKFVIDRRLNFCTWIELPDFQRYYSYCFRCCVAKAKHDSQAANGKCAWISFPIEYHDN
jgi:hypothetical protein